MAKSKYKHYKIIKLFAVLGAVLSIALHIMAIISGFSASNILNAIIFPILGIIVCIVILSSFGETKKQLIEMSWISLLILGILDALLDANYGTLLIVIGAFIALIDRL